MVPMTGQNAVLDASAVQGKTHVRAAVVQGEDAVLVTQHEHWTMRVMKHQPPSGFQLGDRTGVDEMGA